MKKDIAKKWTKELRSGRWEQGRDALCSVESNGTMCYCCLGVLTELYNLNQKKSRKKTLSTENIEDRASDGKNVISYNGNDDVLPDEVMRWAGMSTENGSLLDCELDVDYEHLADMNDSGKSFMYIASIIDQHYESL
jgi:hypothetical protein